MSQQSPPSQSQPANSAGGGGSDDLNNPGMNPVNGSGKGPGDGPVGIFGIIALNVYLIVFALFLVYGLVVLWPGDTPSGQAKQGTTATNAPANPQENVPTKAPAGPAAAGQLTAQPQTSPIPSPSPTPTATAAGLKTVQEPSQPTASASPTPGPKTVTFLSWSFKIWDEQRLLLIVILAGALGSLVHDIRSVYWYIGNRALIKSWLAMYLLLPFTGATLSLVFYLVIRGGFFSPQSSFEQTSPFGFAAFAALIGMFSPQAVLKLREVAETLLSKPPPGDNAKPQETSPAAAATPVVPKPADKPGT
jgi:hypothetical protein